MKFAKTREVTGSIPNAAVRRDSSRIYFVSLLVEKDIQKLPKTGSPLGLMWD
ncbi:Transposase, IS605 OrfB [Bacillus thuringiensis serovar monterrey BGSC 4AJ1]|nr:Transposase, IS605 OrfB [Bacillus thuringiensis serovar monterrey BGSC 4AJ1]